MRRALFGSPPSASRRRKGRRRRQGRQEGRRQVRQGRQEGRRRGRQEGRCSPAILNARGWRRFCAAEAVSLGRSKCE
eukprot:6319204-Heterocapsa_arctica.AAC.1